MELPARLHDAFVERLGPHMAGHPPRPSEPMALARRRNLLFGERGGVFGGRNGVFEAFADLTRRPMLSHDGVRLGVRYACHTDLFAGVAAFHTHPVSLCRDPGRLRRRIDRHLWLSDADVLAFRAQHRRLGFRWHLVASLDVGLFHIEDVLRGRRGPRAILRWPGFEAGLPALEALASEREGLLRWAGVRPSWAGVDQGLAACLPAGLLPSREPGAPEVLALVPSLVRGIERLDAVSAWRRWGRRPDGHPPEARAFRELLDALLHPVGVLGRPSGNPPERA
ncbi:MAG: hypothetical protein VKO64_09155 [Candidatus Sericytochromatia bacterium]|nr:hypothetical protein [Candidatus Sericytochromatia bacterium]